MYNDNILVRMRVLCCSLSDRLGAFENGKVSLRRSNSMYFQLSCPDSISNIMCFRLTARRRLYSRNVSMQSIVVSRP